MKLWPRKRWSLCNSAGIVIEEDILIEEDKPITKKRMEQTREPTHGPQQEHEEFPHQEIPEMPQGIHFPPHNYWEQLRIGAPKSLGMEQQKQETDIQELKSTIGSLKGRRHPH